MIVSADELARLLSATAPEDADPTETAEWLESLEAVLHGQGPDRVRYLLAALLDQARRNGVEPSFSANTPYLNTIGLRQQPAYPGDRDLERRIKSLVRWNALAMVVKADMGGHISTYASAATLYEVGFNHFFHGKRGSRPGDIVFFQGHASPGIYARAFLEGRLTEEHLTNFRRELAPGGGLSSYPHPWLMPGFWEYPTVSMGLGPLMAIYAARFNRYLQDRGIKDTSEQHVWAFLGDGETDEVESLGAIGLAAREKLDNLIFVINCNLQRLDGPVRGNGKIIQELEANFRGAGWNVIKVVWGSDWDALLAADHTGLLAKRMEEVVDGDYQKYVVEGGAYVREHFFGKYPELLELVSHLSDDQLAKLRRGGHDPEKVYAAYKAATEHTGRPTVVLAKTIKGYGLGEAGEGFNTAHQIKKVDPKSLRQFALRFGLALPEGKIEQLPFFKPAEDSAEMKYLRERREALGGPLPERVVKAPALKTPPLEAFDEFLKGSGTRTPSTTSVYATIMARLLADKEIGRNVVPIIPDEARTFGMEVLFSKVGIYSHVGQLYVPADRRNGSLMYYKEAKEGQVLEEGINEAGAMASWIAAGSAHATHGVPMIPFYIYYSMFGFQRIGDLIWAAADTRCRGFLLGATAGRTTLNGEGLQHEDGHSHVMALTVPNCRAYDPAYAYELSVILQDGMKRMYADGEDVFYYVTLYNENYAMPPMPEGAVEGILRGMYKLTTRGNPGKGKTVNLLGSGTILNGVLKAADLLAEKYGVSSNVYSVTSYQELRRDCLEAARWNQLHPDQPARKSYLAKLLDGVRGPFVAASDYMRTLPEQILPFVPGKDLLALGTDGFGRSETRENLRRFFEVDTQAVVAGALYSLAERGELDRAVVAKAVKELGIDADVPAPWTR